MMNLASRFENIKHDRRSVLITAALIGVVLAVFPFVVGATLGNS